jgi:hypothetical protein
MGGMGGMPGMEGMGGMPGMEGGMYVYLTCPKYRCTGKMNSPLLYSVTF